MHNHSTTHESDGAWWEDLVDDFVDGTLSGRESDHLRKAMLSDPKLTSDIDLAFRMRSTFREMKVDSCPASVTNSVRRYVRDDLKESMWNRLNEISRERLVPMVRPVITTLALVIVVVSGALIGRTREKPDPEVVHALAEVRWTLAFLTNVSRQTGSTVREAAIEPLVVERMRSTMDQIIQN